jgi:hypothetical protein
MTVIAPVLRRTLHPLLGLFISGAVLCAGGGGGTIAAPDGGENRPEQAQAAPNTARPARAAPMGAAARPRSAPVEAAMSLPRPPAPGNGAGAAGLPTVLSPSEASRLRRVFDH